LALGSLFAFSPSFMGLNGAPKRTVIL